MTSLKEVMSLFPKETSFTLVWHERTYNSSAKKWENEQSDWLSRDYSSRIKTCL